MRLNGRTRHHRLVPVHLEQVLASQLDPGLTPPRVPTFICCLRGAPLLHSPPGALCSLQQAVAAPVTASSVAHRL